MNDQNGLLRELRKDGGRCFYCGIAILQGGDEERVMEGKDDGVLPD